MDYKIERNKILILNKEDFCPEHILECGQIFSYIKTNYGYDVFSAQKYAKIIEQSGTITIETNDVEYFINFFDLKTNYKKIKENLIENHNFLNKPITFGKGIRILKQDIFETIISFIVSANNNIKRIKKILFGIREKFGKNMGEYFAFPTMQELKNASVLDFKNLGAGYRAQYLYKAVRQLEKEDLLSWQNLSTSDLNEKLLSLMGVGQKVADCIMLFAFAKKDVFPVDTWIEKVYCTYFEDCHNRKHIRHKLTTLFGEASGYAQQYLFYSQRSDN